MIEPGDTLWAIARANGTDVATLRRELVDYGFLDRADGVYRMADAGPDVDPRFAADLPVDLERRLRELRAEGHLVVGSGFMTHGRPSVQLLRADDGTAENWSSDFDLWAAEMLDAGRVDALADFRRQAPGMPHAHPTVEHFTPLFITLGAASSPDVEVRTRIEGFKIGLSKRSIEMS